MKRFFVICLSACLVGFFLTTARGTSPMEPHKFNGIEYLTGGVGLEERTALKNVQNDYDLKLVFARSTGAYLAEVDVQIKDSSGETVLKALSNGPWLLVALPQGRYTVLATNGGITKTGTVVIQKEGGLRKLTFQW